MCCFEVLATWTTSGIASTKCHPSSSSTFLHVFNNSTIKEYIVLIFSDTFLLQEKTLRISVDTDNNFQPTTMDTAKSAASAAAKTTKEAEEKVKTALTCLWNDLPTWQQDNHYIRSGYRPASNSYFKSFSSLAYLHNESVNIYTHLVGAIAALISSVFLYSTLAPRYETATKEDVIVFSCFFAGAIACLGMSATYHTISNHSHAVATWGNQLDYAGIVGLIWGSFVPVLYYAFQRNSELMKRYWIMVCLPPTSSPITT